MSKPDILAAMKEVEGQILSWNQNIRESMKYIESRFADFHSKAISDNSSCGSIKPHFLHLKPQFSSQTAAATIPNSSLSPPLPFNSPPPLPQNNPAPPKQTSSQSSFEELIKKIEAKIAANAITPPPQPEPSGDTQVVTTATSVTIFQEEQLAAKIVDVSNNPCGTKRIAYAPEMRVVRYVHKVFDELTEMDSSSPKEVAASGALRKNSYIFIEEKKAGDSSTDKIGHISIQRELSLAGGEKIQVYMNEKWANLHIAPAATLTDYFKKKGTETLRVFDPGGSAFDARVREAGNSLFGVFYFSCFKMKWVSTKVHDWMRDSFLSYCDTALNYLAARLRMNRKVVLCNVVTKSIALGVVGCNICWLNVICLVPCFTNVLSVWPLARSLTVSFKGILVELLVWKWLKMVREHACKLTHCLLLVSVGLFVCLRCYLSAVIICMTWLLPQWIGGIIGVDIAILQLLNLKGIRKLSGQEVTVGDKIDDEWFLELGMTAASLVERRGHYSTIHLEDKVVLKSYHKAGHTLDALDLLGSFEKGSCKPNVYAYNTVIDRLCKDQMVDDALQLFSSLAEKGVPPNVVTYSSMIEGLCKFGRWEEIDGLLKKMVARNIHPNVVTCTLIVDALCKEGRVEEAGNILKTMKEIDVHPTIITYNAMINGYCLRGEMDEARNIFDSLVDSGIKPDIFSYSTLMNGYSKEG